MIPRHPHDEPAQPARPQLVVTTAQVYRRLNLQVRAVIDGQLDRDVAVLPRWPLESGYHDIQRGDFQLGGLGEFRPPTDSGIGDLAALDRECPLGLAGTFLPIY